MVNTLNHDLIVLGLLWVAYCAIHSLLIADPVKNIVNSLFGDRQRYYRIFFNLLSALLLIPVLLYERKIESPPLITYRGLLRIPQLFLVTGSLALFYFGARGYDMSEFLGLKQLKEDYQERGVHLATGGVLGFVRHPWYLAGTMIIWGRNPSGKVITTNIVLTGYFIVGCYLEERKLVRVFGASYREYQREVSMLIPIKWIRNKLGRSR